MRIGYLRWLEKSAFYRELEPIGCVYKERGREEGEGEGGKGVEIYFKNLTHVTTEVGRSKNCSGDWQAGESGL